LITLIDRYLLREVLKAMSAILLVLTLILSSNSFIKLLKEVSTGELHAELLAQALALQMVIYFSRLIPPAFFFAVLYVVGRMYRDSEMVALESCGIGGMRIYRSMVLVVVPVALITGWLSLYVTPWAGRLSAELLSSQQGQAMELAGISAGRFNEYSQGDLVLYVESLDKDERRMQKVFVQQRREGALILVSAKRGYQRIDNENGDRYLVLEDGLRYSGIPGQADYQVSEFDEYALLIKASSGGKAKVTRRSLSSYELLHSDSIKERAEFQVRLSQVLALLVFALLSLPLSRTLPRQGPFGRLVFAFVLYTVYLSLQGAAENWMINTTTPEWLGIWWVHLLLAVTGLLMLLPDTPPARRFKRRLRSQSA
jgi:lipopolysaccharide export system permease protein